MKGPGLIERGATNLVKIDNKVSALRRQGPEGRIRRRVDAHRDTLVAWAQTQTSGRRGLEILAGRFKTRDQIRESTFSYKPDPKDPTGKRRIGDFPNVMDAMQNQVTQINSERIAAGKPPLTPDQIEEFTGERMQEFAATYVRSEENKKKMDVIQEQFDLKAQGKPTAIDARFLEILEKERDKYKMELLIRLLRGLAAFVGAETLQTLNTAETTVPIGQQR